MLEAADQPSGEHNSDEHERRPLLQQMETSSSSRSRKHSIESISSPPLSLRKEHNRSSGSSTITVTPNRSVARICGRDEESTIPAALDGEAPLPLNLRASNRHGITTLRAVVIILAIFVLVFLQSSNVSLLTTTQGVIAADLDAFESTTWFTSVYLLGISSVSPVFGKISYVFETRACLLASALVMAVGASITGWSPNLAVFLLGRVVAGIAGAAVITFAQVLVPLTSERRRGLAQGSLNTGYTVGLAAGAMLAGFIEPRLGWRSMFWLQLPFSVTAGVALFFAVPSTVTSLETGQPKSEVSTMTKLARIDYVGAILLVATIVCFLYGVGSPDLGTLSKAPIITILISIFILLPLFVYQEAYRHAEPIIPVKVLKSRGVLLSCFASLGYMMSRYSVIFYTPIYATAVRGEGPARSGSLLVPTNFGFAMGNLLSGYLHITRSGSFYLACLAVFTIFPLTLLAIGLSSTLSVSLGWYSFLLFLNGLCAGGGMNYTLAHIQHLAHKDVKIIVISLFVTFRGFAGTFGATVGGGLFIRSLHSSLAFRFAEKHLTPPVGLLRELEGSPRAVQNLTGFFKDAAIQGYVDALRTLFLAGVGLAVVTLILQAGTGWKSPEDEDYDSSQSMNDEEETRGRSPADERRPLLNGDVQHSNNE